MPLPHAPSVWICLPTYNEAQLVVSMLGTLLSVFDEHDIDGHVLVIDDNSPDGTGELADRVAAHDPRIEVLHRPGKQGLGRAYLAGFRHVLDAGADLIVEMDCDFSHDPWALPDLLEAASAAHLVLGSRYVDGGAVVNWPRSRRLVSRGGSFYGRTVLDVPIRDLTGGFKCFRREVLETLPLREVSAAGYGFQVELTYRALRAGFSVAEVPITFRDRELGESKMSGAIAMEAARGVLVLRMTVGRRPVGVPAPAIAERAARKETA